MIADQERARIEGRCLDGGLVPWSLSSIHCQRSTTNCQLSSTGFTLVEIVVALAVLMIVAAVTAPAFLRAPPRRPPLDEAQGRFEALFRLARDSAVRSGVPVTVVLDSATTLVWIDAPPRWDLDDAGGIVAEGGGLSDIALGRGSVAALPASPVGLRIGMYGNGQTRPGESIDLPAGVSVELFTRRALFTFHPDGTVTGDSLVLSVAGGGRRHLILDPWIGRVRMR